MILTLTVNTAPTGEMPTLPSIDPGDYDLVYNGQTITDGITLSNGVSNVLIRDCTISDSSGSGIYINNATNVVIYNNTIGPCFRNGIITDPGSVGSGLVIWNNTLDNIQENGIHTTQRSTLNPAGDWPDTLIYNNTLYDTGLGNNTGHHGIYTQTTNCTIWGNTLDGHVGGNGISFRSDGTIRDNYVRTNTERSGYGSQIKYYPDHKTGISKQLLIKNNVTALVGSGTEQTYGIEIDYVSYGGAEADEDWYVNDFIIQDNDVTCLSTEYPVSAEYTDSGNPNYLSFVTVTQSGNT